MTGFPISTIVFYVFSVCLIGSALFVITCRNTVYAVLALIFAFFSSAALWILMQSEFLGLILVVVYVGAVMTLLLFVVMMLNIDLEKIREKFTKLLPLAAMILIFFLVILVLALNTTTIPQLLAKPVDYPAQYSNTTALGTLLFTQYLYPFEIAAMILLVAMISAISLAFFGRKPGTRTQNIRRQHEVTKASRLKVIKSEKS